MKRVKFLIVFLLLLFPLLSFSAELPPVTNFTLQNAASSGNGTDAQISGYSAIGVSIIGTAGSDRVVTFSVSGDGTNFSTVTCRNLSSLALSTTLTTSGTTVYNFTCPIAGMNKFRAALSGGATGTITVKGIAIAGASVSSIPSMLPPFVIGDLFYADSVNSIARLADVATGQILVSGGVGAAPAYSATPVVTNITADTTTLVVDSTNHRVGVGTATPSVLAHIYQSQAAATSIYVENPSVADVAASQLYLVNTGNYFLAARQYGQGYTSTLAGVNLAGLAAIISGASSTNLLIQANTGSVNLAQGTTVRLAATSTGVSVTGIELISTSLGVGANITTPTYAVEINGTLGFHDSSGVTFDAVLTRSSSSPQRILTVLSKGGAAGWRGAVNIDLSYNAGTAITALNLVANTDGTTARGTLLGDFIATAPAAQTIAATNTITADACGGVKQITAASGVTTNTTNTFTAPSAANAGCKMMVCNVGVTNTITLDKNTLFFTTGGADLALAANTCVEVISDGTQWRQTTAVLTAS